MSDRKLIVLSFAIAILAAQGLTLLGVPVGPALSGQTGLVISESN